MLCPCRLKRRVWSWARTYHIFPSKAGGEIAGQRNLEECEPTAPLRLTPTTQPFDRC